jgi:hypothetical protein
MVVQPCSYDSIPSGHRHEKGPTAIVLMGFDRAADLLWHWQRVIHRADRGELSGLVVDEQERCVLRSDEVVGERVTHGHWSGSGTFS